MTIEFEPPDSISQLRAMLQTVALEMMRSHSRTFDENEGAIPWDYIEFMHQAMKSFGGGSLAPRDARSDGNDGGQARAHPSVGYQMLASQIEVLAWGDVGMYLITPGGGLGAAALQAAATPEQKAKFLTRFSDEKPTFACMSITEPGGAR